MYFSPTIIDEKVQKFSFIVVESYTFFSSEVSLS